MIHALTPHKPMLQGIYAISDEILTPYELLPQYLESALKGGVRIFQLRDKTHSDEWLYPIAKALMELCEAFEALFVINDRLSLAIKLNAPALHLGKDDMSITQARECFSGILGASSYGDLQRAQELESLGVDYVAFGAFFPSPTKPNAAQIPLEILPQAKKTLKIPLCAIGGISTQNIHLLKNADMCAVISTLWQSKKENAQSQIQTIYENAKALCHKFSQAYD